MDQLPLSFGSQRSKRRFPTQQSFTTRPTNNNHQMDSVKSDEKNIFSEKNLDLGNEHHDQHDNEIDSDTMKKSSGNDNEQQGDMENATSIISLNQVEMEVHRDSDESEEEEDDEDVGEFPIERFAILRGEQDGTRQAITALAVDPRGARVLTGSLDYHIKFWDFGGMDRSLRSFRSVVPEDGYPVTQIAYSTTGDRFACAMDSAQPRIYDRDGFSIATMVKGDVYLNDMQNTKGHTAPVKAIEWNPVDRMQIMTASADSTVRMWDVETCEKRHLWLTRARNARGTKTAITSAAFDGPGSRIATGCLDGSLQIFDVRARGRPKIVIRPAHAEQQDVTSVAFARDGWTLASRSMDHTLKVWDVRKPKQPLKVFANLHNRYSQTDCMFSHDDEYILTGVSSPGKHQSGNLTIIEKQTLQVVETLEPGSGVPGDDSAERTISDGGGGGVSVIRTVWHPDLNQIFLGCSNGNTYVYYDRELSNKGILMSLARAVRTRVDGVAMAAPTIIVPLEEKRMRRQRLKEQKMMKLQRHVPSKSEEVDSSTGPTIRLGSENYTHLMMPHIKKHEIDTDPRAALLKYDEEVKANPYFVAPAYEQTQPQTVLDYDAAELERKEDEEQMQREFEESAESRFGSAKRENIDHGDDNSDRKRQKKQH